MNLGYFFPNYMENYGTYFGYFSYFSISFEENIFYNVIFMTRICGCFHLNKLHVSVQKIAVFTKTNILLYFTTISKLYSVHQIGFCICMIICCMHPTTKCFRFPGQIFGFKTPIAKVCGRPRTQNHHFFRPLLGLFPTTPRPSLIFDTVVHLNFG